MKSVPAHSYLLTLLSAFTIATASAQSPLSGPTPGVLALRNGQIISGNILRDGDRYLVTLGESAEIRIRVNSVEFHGQNLQQLYQLKYSSLVPTDIDGKFDLVEWSLRHGLLPQAEQLLHPRPLQPRARARWTDLKRRLDLARRPVARTVIPLTPAPQPGTRPEMDTLLKDISGINMQEFAGFVQPLLLNTCSTTTCHGAQSKTSFKLIAPPRGRAIPTRYTRRNFYSTWKTLTPRNPDQSPLLNITTAPHGGAPTLFSQREWDQYQRLVNWARNTSRKTGPSVPREIEPPATILSQSRPLPVPSSNQTDLVGGPTPVTPTTPIDKGSLGTRQSTAQPGQKTVPPKRLPHTVDPFDPNLFNRQFHAARFKTTPTEPADPQEVSAPAATQPPETTPLPDPLTPG
jgi:hypothetical protein